MIPGDMLPITVFQNGKSAISQALVLEVWSFREYCEEADKNELEIDVDDVWEAWKSRGPVVVIMCPVEGKPRVVWSGDENR